MDPSFEDFKASWLEPVIEGNPTTIQLGHRLDIDDDSLDATYCDGAGDGGIDIAVLDRADPVNADDEPEGDTWYLVQSKYGSAFAGSGTLLAEGQKLVETLDGRRTNLSSLVGGILEKLTNFRGSATERDQICLVYATVDPLTPEQQRTLDYVRAMGRDKLGTLFDVSAISVRTIYDAQAEETEAARRRHLTFELSGHLTQAGNDLLVGSVSLTVHSGCTASVAEALAADRGIAHRSGLSTTSRRVQWGPTTGPQDKGAAGGSCGSDWRC